MSQGIIRIFSLSSFSLMFHWGRIIVKEFFIAFEMPRSWQKGLSNQIMSSYGHTFVSIKRTGFTSSSNSVIHSTDRSWHLSTNPSLLSSPSSLSSRLSAAMLFSISVDKAISALFMGTLLSSSPLSFPDFFFGRISNWWRMLLTVRFKIWRKHQVWFAAPGKFSRRLAISSTILSLFEALSDVTLRI